MLFADMRVVAGAERFVQTSRRLTREQVISRIMRRNPGATADFLNQFSSDALGEYLDRLRTAEMPRQGRYGWKRKSGPSPIVVRGRAALV